MANNYKSNLQSHNTNLQAILNTINTLPDAGSGNATTCQVTLQNSTEFNLSIFYTTGLCEPVEHTLQQENVYTFDVIKNSIFIVRANYTGAKSLLVSSSYSPIMQGYINWANHHYISFIATDDILCTLNDVDINEPT